MFEGDRTPFHVRMGSALLWVLNARIWFMQMFFSPSLPPSQSRPVVEVVVWGLRPTGYRQAIPGPPQGLEGVGSRREGESALNPTGWALLDTLDLH